MAFNVDVQKVCEQLDGLDRRSKVTTLENLKNLCKTNDGEVALSAREVSHIFDELYLHLLKCYSDRFESVREKAVDTVTQFIKRLPPSGVHISTILETLMIRMGKEPILEECEEIRLLSSCQLHALIRIYLQPAKCRVPFDITRYIVEILCRSVTDNFPAVQREACTSIVSLCTIISIVDIPQFEFFAEQLVKSMFGILNHKHSQVRIAAIQAFARLSLHVQSNGDTLPRIMMEVSPLLMDPMPMVRRECGEMGVLLALELRDRYSYFDRIIPLILCCLKDESSDVVTYIRARWVKCGQQYFNENETELRRQELADTIPGNYPQDLIRPTIGCRALVQRSLRLVHLITREMCDWKDDVRLHSLKLLYQFVLHAEGAMTAKFFLIYPHLAKACWDVESIVANEAVKVAELMGLLLAYGDWFCHALEHFKNPNPGCLKCFCHMFESSGVCRIQDVICVAAITVRPIYSQTLDVERQLYVLRLVKSLLSKMAAAGDNKLRYPMEDTRANLYITIMKVMALAKEIIQDPEMSDDLQTKGNGLLHELAEQQFMNVPQLHEKFFLRVWAYVVDLDAMLDEGSETILLLCGLLKVAQFRASYMEHLPEKIITIWESNCVEAACKVFETISKVMLNWHQTMGPYVYLEESICLLNDFFKVIVEQNFASPSPNMRSLAAATVCSMTQGAPIECRHVLPICAAKYMPDLLEDDNYATRYQALKSLYNFGPISMTVMIPIAEKVLQYLCDSSGDIAELAATALIKLEPAIEENKDDNKQMADRQSWDSIIRKACPILFEQYSVVENRRKVTFKNAIMGLNQKYPKIMEQAFTKALLDETCSISIVELQKEFNLGESDAEKIDIEKSDVQETANP